jgi:hypothetical protein
MHMPPTHISLDALIAPQNMTCESWQHDESMPPLEHTSSPVHGNEEHTQVLMGTKSIEAKRAALAHTAHHE